MFHLCKKQFEWQVLFEPINSDEFPMLNVVCILYVSVHVWKNFFDNKAFRAFALHHSNLI